MQANFCSPLHSGLDCKMQSPKSGIEYKLAKLVPSLLPSLLCHSAETAGLQTSEIFYLFWQKTRVTNFIWVQVVYKHKKDLLSAPLSHQPHIQDWSLSASFENGKSSSTHGPWKGQSESLKHTSKTKCCGLGESCHSQGSREAVKSKQRIFFKSVIHSGMMVQQ